MSREDASTGIVLRRLQRATAIAVVVLLVGTAALTTKAMVPTHTATSGSLNAASVEGPAPPNPTAGPTSTVNVVIIGDSHAWLWAPRIPVIPDLGVPGAVSYQMQDQLATAMAARPRFIVFSAGTNDLNEGHGWISVAVNLSKMFDQVKSAGITPVVLLIPPYGPAMSTGIWAQLGLLPAEPASLPMQGADQVASLNNALRGTGVATLEAPPGRLDGVHLDTVGYAELTRQLHALTD